MKEVEAIEFAQNFLISQSGLRGAVRFARHVPAYSTDLLDDNLPEDYWDVFFDIGIRHSDPDFFVLRVKPVSGTVESVAIM